MKWIETKKPAKRLYSPTSKHRAVAVERDELGHVECRVAVEHRRRHPRLGCLEVGRIGLAESPRPVEVVDRAVVGVVPIGWEVRHGTASQPEARAEISAEAKSSLREQAIAAIPLLSLTL